MITTGENRVYLAIYTEGGGQPFYPPCGDTWLKAVDAGGVAPIWGWAETQADALNSAWCAALNSRRQFEWTHFAAIRADIKCLSDDWHNVLLDEMRRVQVEFLSAIIPLPGEEGVTDCAVEEFPCPSNEMPRLRPLTMTEVDPQAHITFTASEMEAIGFANCRLLPGASLFACDFRKDWIEKVVFHNKSGIRVEKGANNTPGAAIAKLKMPEDWATDLFVPQKEECGWDLARQLHALGVPIGATRRIPTIRYGPAPYGSMTAWGDIKEAEWREAI